MKKDYCTLILEGIKEGDQIGGPYKLAKIFSKSLISSLALLISFKYPLKLEKKPLYNFIDKKIISDLLNLLEEFIFELEKYFLGSPAANELLLIYACSFAVFIASSLK